MSDVSLVPVGNKRVAIPGLSLPSPPPTRIYISGHEYQIQAPRVSLPTIANMVKAIFNYTLPAARVAKNILHIFTPGTFNTSVVSNLQALADAVFNAATTGSSAIPNMFTSGTSLQSVTIRDMGGTSTSATSTHAPQPGVATGTGLPPQCAVTISWSITSSYRGGKPRTYVPTPPLSAVVPTGSSTLDPTFCTQADGYWTALMNAINALTVAGGGGYELGTVSYYTGHGVRPVPLFVPFIGVRVHERLDSQRRRSGPEVLFPVTP